MARIVIAGASEVSREQLSRLLSSSGYSVFRCCGAGSELRRTVNECDDGVVIMLGSLPDCKPDELQWDYGDRIQILLIGKPALLESCEAPEIFRLALPASSQAVIGPMLRAHEGCIVNISSMNAFTPLTKIPAYSAAKSGVSNFTEWLAVHFAKSGIRCNAIAPGFFSAQQNAKLLWNEDGTPTERTKKILAGTPMGRFGQPEELIAAALFLLDDASAGFITGVVLPVDGGFGAYSGV